MQGILIILLVLGACSSRRTPYQEFDKEVGGYRDRIVEDDIRSARFEANYKTKRTYAEFFARFRALETCRAAGQPLSHVLGVIDRSSEKKVLRGSGDYWGPSYYYGLSSSPFYSRYSGFGFSTGINVVNSRAWEETLVLPDVEVLYHCTEKVFEPGLVLRDVPPEEMKLLVKDLKGGVQVEKILPGSTNKKIKVGDVIIKARGERLSKGYEVLALFRKGPGPAEVSVLREGKELSIPLVAHDVTERVRADLAALLKKACEFDDIRDETQLCKEKP